MDTSLDKGFVTWKFYQTVSTYKSNTKVSHVKQELLILSEHLSLPWFLAARWDFAITWRPSSVVRPFVCPSVRPSYVVNFNLLLRNHWANCNQTLVEWYLYGSLPKLCPLIPTSSQDGRQAKNIKKGGWNFNRPLLQ